MRRIGDRRFDTKNSNRAYFFAASSLRNRSPRSFASGVRFSPKSRPNLPLTPTIDRTPLQPLHRLVHRPHLPHPVPRDKLLRLRKRPVDDRALFPREFHALPLRRRLQPIARQHHAGFHQLLVVLPHLGKNLRVRKNASLGLLARLYDDHDSHTDISKFLGFERVHQIRNPASIYTSNEERE